MALPAHLALELVTPDHAVVHDLVEEVNLPGREGYFGVLPGHTPLLALLDPGQMWYRRGSDLVYLAVGGGLAEVLPDRVTVLAQVAERAEEIDIARAEAARRRAESRLSKPTGEVDMERARIALMRSLVRLQVAARARTRG